MYKSTQKRGPKQKCRLALKHRECGNISLSPAWFTLSHKIYDKSAFQNFCQYHYIYMTELLFRTSVNTIIYMTELLFRTSANTIIYNRSAFYNFCQCCYIRQMSFLEPKSNSSVLSHVDTLFTNEEWKKAGSRNNVHWCHQVKKCQPKNNGHFCNQAEKDCTKKKCTFLPWSRESLYQETMDVSATEQEIMYISVRE